MFLGSLPRGCRRLPRPRGHCIAQIEEVSLPSPPSPSPERRKLSLTLLDTYADVIKVPTAASGVPDRRLVVYHKERLCVTNPDLINSDKIKSIVRLLARRSGSAQEEPLLTCSAKRAPPGQATRRRKNSGLRALTCCRIARHSFLDDTGGADGASYKERGGQGRQMGVLGPVSVEFYRGRGSRSFQICTTTRSTTWCMASSRWRKAREYDRAPRIQGQDCDTVFPQYPHLFKSSRYSIIYLDLAPTWISNGAREKLQMAVTVVAGDLLSKPMMTQNAPATIPTAIILYPAPE
ncbi:hypothetical protein B0H11DRAFT_2223800 [Mycena galericulata]|nr:hypothetical protein B0H11DRAFT_2223800 [Mycena galericulata]